MSYDYGYGMAERFARETAKHQMTVLHDDGLYRHIRFQQRWWQPPLLKQQTSSMYWFDLITVPGTLIFQGDGESYTFRRVEDMFEFFRGRVGRINPQYWAEKLTCSRREGVKVYDEAIFKAKVIERFTEAARYSGVPAGTGRALREQVLVGEYICDEGEARRLLDDFEHGAALRASCSCGASQEFAESDATLATLWRSSHITMENAHRQHRSTVERAEGFRFSDTWEWDFQGWDWWFLWACHAIVWGIACYDAGAVVPGPVSAPAESAPAAAVVPTGRRIETVEATGGVL